MARGRVGRTPRGRTTPARQTLGWASDGRVTLAGLAVGALVVASIIAGSSALALLASLIAIAASVVSPLIGMIALAFVAPLARPLVIPPPGLYVAMGAAMVLGIILRLPIDRPRLRPPSAEVLLLGAFLLYAAAQFLGGRLDGYSGQRGVEIGSMFARLTEAVVTFAVAYVVLRGRSPYPVLTAMLLAAAVSSALALSQLVGADGAFTNLMESPGLSGRVSGAFADPNMFGAYLAVMITLAVACTIIVRSRWVKAMLLALAVFLSASLLITQSRGAIVAVMAGLITIAFVRSRKAGFLAIASVILVAVIAYPAFSAWRFGDDGGGAAIGLSSAADASGRVGAWRAGADLFESSPLFGIGFGQWQDEASVTIGPHNWYVQVLAELGVTGFILWSLFTVATVLALRRRSRPARTVGYSVLVVWMVASLTLLPPIVFRMTGPVLIVVAAAIVADWASGRRDVDTATISEPANANSPSDIASPLDRLAGGRGPNA